MIKRALVFAAVCLALALPGEVRGQSLFAELGLVEEGESVASSQRTAEATRPQTSYSSSLALGGPRATSEEDLDDPAIVDTTEPESTVQVAQVRRSRTSYSSSLNLGAPSAEGEEDEDAGSTASRQTDPRDRAVAGASGGLFSLFDTSNSSIPYQFRRQSVRYETDQRPGTIVIDTSTKFLYHVGERGYATRYGVGVGRAGFEWKGTAYIGHKREWPDWHPPASMRAREPWLPVRMEGGPENPLGARAMYLYRGGADTLYRIHGTNQPTSIGQALSSGCIRMLNEDVIHLYQQVDSGTRVVVL